MKSKKKYGQVAFVFALVATLSLTACGQKEAGVAVHFDVHVEKSDKDSVSPLFVEISKDKEKGSHEVATVWLFEKDKKKNTSIQLTPGQYNIRYITPIQQDGSLYEIKEKEKLTISSSSKEQKPSVDLKHVPQEEVTSKQLQEVTDDIKGRLKEDPNNEELKKIYQKAKKAVDKKEDTEKVVSFLDVLNRPEAYIDTSYYEDAETKSWSYAWFSPNPKEAPYLLLCLNVTGDRVGDQSSVSVIGWDEQNKKCVVMNQDVPIAFGASAAGGYRGSLSTDDKALYNVSWSSGTGDAYEDTIEFKEQKLTRLKTWEGRIDAYSRENVHPISFCGREYKKPFFEAFPKGEALWKAYCSEKANHPAEVSYAGTLRIFHSHEEMLHFQGKDDQVGIARNWSPLNYVVLVFDQPQPVTARNGDGRGGTRTQEGRLLLVNSYPNQDQIPQLYKDLDGKAVRIEFSGLGYWQSDVSLPLGEARMNHSKPIEIFEQ